MFVQRIADNFDDLKIEDVQKIILVYPIKACGWLPTSVLSEIIAVLLVFIWIACRKFAVPLQCSYIFFIFSSLGLRSTEVLLNVNHIKENI